MEIGIGWIVFYRGSRKCTDTDARPPAESKYGPRNVMTRMYDGLGDDGCSWIFLSDLGIDTIRP